VREISVDKVTCEWSAVLAARGAAANVIVEAAARISLRVVFMVVLLNRVIAMRNDYAFHGLRSVNAFTGAIMFFPC
jgi:hypothetical protein